MNTPIHYAYMNNYTHKTSPDFSSLPSESPSEPEIPARHDQRHMSSGRFDLSQQEPQQPYLEGQPQAPGYSMDGVRLTKDGVPRKRPGRKPGTVGRRSGDDITPMTSPGPVPAVVSDIEAPKQKRARKLKDPSAPPVPRKRRAQPEPATGDEMGLSRSSSAHIHFEPKAEFTSMRMDFDPRPTPHPLGPSAILSSTTQTHLHPRKQPLQPEKPPAKREAHQSSVMSILNVDDSPPRTSQLPASTTPVRSVGQSYDPIRSSYDPVRETMFSRDPYGTGSMGSPRAPPQLTSRTSASPSIASLVNPAPIHHSRSPDSSFATAYTQASPPTMSIAAATSSNATLPARYRDNNASLPPSPSPAPALRATSVLIQSSNPPPPPSSILKSGTTSSNFSPQITTIKDTNPTMPALALSKTSTSKASTTARASKAATKADAKAAKASAKDESDTQSRPHSKPPPAPPVPASAKSTATKPPTKAAEKRAATAAAKAAAADAKAAAAATKAASKAAASEASSNTSADEPTPKPSGPTTTSFKDVAVSASGSAATTAAASAAPHIKKFSSILQQDRGGKQAKSAPLSPKLTAAKGDGHPSGPMALDSSPQAEPERSILDFGKALPGEENTVPSIVLHIPLVKGETNKYVNFMRMAEERYGWDALHPRLAAHRDRKLRIAAASAALERNGSGRESGDEMTDDMQSADEGSNEENGAAADTTIIGVIASGPEDAPAKPARKKRIFKEDEYDKDDDFVDDSEMMWEEQAATSRDGFFVYSGPLIPEEEKPAEGTSTPVKRGRGSRGGRGGSTRGGARTATGRGAGGPGSRGGGAPRKPRATKQEKEARDREKAELKEASAKAAAAKAAAAKEQPFSSDMAIDDI